MESAKPFVDRKKMTNLGEAVAGKLRKTKRPVVSDTEIAKAIEEVYSEGKVRYLRGEQPTFAAYDRTRSILKSEKIISRDADYHRFWRVNTVPDSAAEEITCLVDDTVYVSHLSAMQTYGLTNRRPTDLYLTRANDAYWNELKRERLNETQAYDKFNITLFRTHHPGTVRGRRLSILSTKNFGRQNKLRDSPVRLSSIGQTFRDMLSNPELCGGMAHVLEVFEDRAYSYLDEIIREIDAAGSPITKVRAGYIFSERMKLDDSRLQQWLQFAQRGGSRVLDPQKPFASKHSEKWMISINV